MVNWDEEALKNWPPVPIVVLRPNEALVDVTPREMPEPHNLEGRIGYAVCQHCEMVVSREQAVVSGVILPTDERHDHRPVFAHNCKQGQGILHLYADLY